ncbi:MAG TPA: hypothetical protein PLA68_14220 [Panacibacter sp.]|nr:hypothetical protein [Panacibacter sp.]
MSGQQPRFFMDIHDVSEVNRPQIELSLIEGPATSDTFNTQKTD